MSKCKQALCLLLAMIMALSCLSTAFCAAAADGDVPTQTAPLTVQVEMSKSIYFVTAKAKATVTVQNTGSEPLQNVIVCAYSEKHLLPKGGSSMLLIPELAAGKSASYSFDMVLNYRAKRVSIFDRIVLYFVQLFRSYDLMAGIPDVEGTAVKAEASFLHGITKATLQVEAFLQRPDVTYLDRYVTNILKTGTFTLETETTQEGLTIPMTVYDDGNSFAVETSVTNMMAKELGLSGSLNLGKVRLLIKDRKTDPKAYIVFPGGYYEASNSEDFYEMWKDMEENQDINMLSQLIDSGMLCCGVTNGAGYVCESYQDAEGKIQYNFYFTKTNDGYEGIVRWDTVNLETGKTDETIAMHLYPTITDKKAFKVCGKKYTEEDLEKLFGGSVG